jgi:REP element-mobilizing transposase RayT
MGRIPRKHSLIEDSFYHVITRGNNKKVIFKEPDDCLRWLSLLKSYKKEYKTRVLAYCLMPNHYHLLIQASSELSQFMCILNVQYAKFFNKKYNISGHLFGDRFKSFLVADDPYLLTLIRYIHNNPVRANLTDNPLSYEFSSLKDYQRKNGIIDTKLIEKIVDKFAKKSILKILS